MSYAIAGLAIGVLSLSIAVISGSFWMERTTRDLEIRIRLLEKWRREEGR